MLITPGNTLRFGFKSFCGGTLIDKRKILTSAPCLYGFLEPYNITYENKTYLIEIKTNQYHPTIFSMYTVYLGVQNKSTIYNSRTYSPPTIAMSVQDMQKVN